MFKKMSKNLPKSVIPNKKYIMKKHCLIPDHWLKSGSKCFAFSEKTAIAFGIKTERHN